MKPDEALPTAAAVVVVDTADRARAALPEPAETVGEGALLLDDREAIRHVGRDEAAGEPDDASGKGGKAP
ncbi:hypothetical protein ACH4UV_18325 [Streptomyces sp. NPDC020802]|uniref:hypothetical protein n=1 Tax=Streptomyces sp. NPDC020802 TaxID=3365094 RepID=UPI00378BA2E9